MKTFVQFQLECLESIDRNSLNEGLIDNIKGFIPKSKSKGGYTGQVQRVGQQVLNRVGNYANQAKKQVTNKVGNYTNQVQRVGREVSNRVGSEIDKVKSKLAPAPKRTNKNDGSSRDSSSMSGIDKIRGSLGAAREAVPALASGAFGINRTDRNISPEMEKEIKSAHSRALARKSKDIDYKDYADTPAGFAAQKTMGRIGDKDWKRDNKGKITGLRQTYDTNKSTRQLAGEWGNAIKTGNLSQAIFKPAELALSITQKRGLTKHDVDFNKKPSDNKNDSASLSKKVYSPNQIKAYSTVTAPIRSVKNALTPTPNVAKPAPVATKPVAKPAPVATKPVAKPAPVATKPVAKPAPVATKQNISNPSSTPTNTTTHSSADNMKIWAAANPKLAAKLKS